MELTRCFLLAHFILGPARKSPIVHFAYRRVIKLANQPIAGDSRSWDRKYISGLIVGPPESHHRRIGFYFASNFEGFVAKSTDLRRGDTLSTSRGN